MKRGAAALDRTIPSVLMIRVEGSQKNLADTRDRRGQGRIAGSPRRWALPATTNRHDCKAAQGAFSRRPTCRSATATDPPLTGDCPQQPPLPPPCKGWHGGGAGGLLRGEATGFSFFSGAGPAGIIRLTPTIPVALTAGTRLGAYEVIAQVGMGGIGEVYRARDTKLNRDVALKILPEAFTLDGDRIARFRREAQV